MGAESEWSPPSTTGIAPFSMIVRTPCRSSACGGKQVAGKRLDIPEIDDVQDRFWIDADFHVGPSTDAGVIGQANGARSEPGPGR